MRSNETSLVSSIFLSAAQARVLEMLRTYSGPSDFGLNQATFALQVLDSVANIANVVPGVKAIAALALNIVDVANVCLKSIAISSPSC